MSVCVCARSANQDSFLLFRKWRDNSKRIKWDEWTINEKEKTKKKITKTSKPSCSIIHKLPFSFVLITAIFSYRFLLNEKRPTEWKRELKANCIKITQNISVFYHQKLSFVRFVVEFWFFERKWIFAQRQLVVKLWCCGGCWCCRIIIVSVHHTDAVVDSVSVHRHQVNNLVITNQYEIHIFRNRHKLINIIACCVYYMKNSSRLNILRKFTDADLLMWCCRLKPRQTMAAAVVLASMHTHRRDW